MESGLSNLITSQIQAENLSIEVTTRCTNNCRHCFARAGRKNLSDLSLDNAQSIVDEAYELGYRHLHLTGGEPLLWDNLFDLLDYSNEKGYETCFINTNGSLLIDEIARRFRSYKMKVSVSISLHGSEDLHDDLSGEGSFKSAVRGINNALNTGLRVTIFTVARRGIVNQLPYFVDYVFKELAGINEVTLIQIIRVPAVSMDIAAELLRPEDFIRLIQTASLLNLYGYRTSVLENPLAKVASELMGIPWLALSPAFYRSGKIVLMANCSLTLAHSSRESLGIYYPGMLANVLVSEQYLKRIGPDTIVCPSCRFHGICTSKGMIRPSEWFRDLDDKTPYCQKVLNMVETNH